MRASFCRSALTTVALMAGWIIVPAGAAVAAGPNLLETSHTLSCGKVEITLRNVSPWIYPVTVTIDGVQSYGPTVDNRTDTDNNGTLDLNGPQQDRSATRTITFPEDSGTHTVTYVVNAGSENQLYVGQPVGTPTTVQVDSDCFGPNLLETSDVVTCGAIDITLRNVSPWIYPVTVTIDGVDSYGPTVDNRTDTDNNGTLDLNGPQQDRSVTRTITFPEDSGTHTVSYVVNAGSENQLYVGLPVGTPTTRTVESDCVTDAGSGAGSTGGGGQGQGAGSSGASGDQRTSADLPAAGSSMSPAVLWWAMALLATGGVAIRMGAPRARGRHLAG